MSAGLFTSAEVFIKFLLILLKLNIPTYDWFAQISHKKEISKYIQCESRVKLPTCKTKLPHRQHRVFITARVSDHSPSQRCMSCFQWQCDNCSSPPSCMSWSWIHPATLASRHHSAYQTKHLLGFSQACIVLYSSIYVMPLNRRWPTEALLVRLVQVKGHVLRSDKDVERLDNKKETTEQDNLHVNRSSCTISMFLKPAIS